MPDQDVRTFLYEFDPVRPEMITDPTAWAEEDDRIAEARFEYLKQATEEGIVLLAGRPPDGKGPAIVILDAETEHEAPRLMQNDPFVARGLKRATLHPFRASLIRREGRPVRPPLPLPCLGQDPSAAAPCGKSLL